MVSFPSPTENPVHPQKNHFRIPFEKIYSSASGNSGHLDREVCFRCSSQFNTFNCVWLWCIIRPYTNSGWAPLVKLIIQIPCYNRDAAMQVNVLTIWFSSFNGYFPILYRENDSWVITLPTITQKFCIRQTEMHFPMLDFYFISTYFHETRKL
jgi:hypothetical protein